MMAFSTAMNPMAPCAALPAFYPAWMEIDLDAIAHNYRLMRRQVGDATLIFPVVKSNAYGHGLIPVSRRLLAEGANGVCIARLWEAGALRRAGVQAPIICLTSVFPEERWLNSPWVYTASSPSFSFWMPTSIW